MTIRKPQHAIATQLVRRLRDIRKPVLYCGDSALSKQVVGQIDRLHRHYHPTPWLHGCHAQLLYMNLRKKAGDQLGYDRIEPLIMADGGTTALAWRGDNLPADTPILVILHTITGSPESMREMVGDLGQLTGWRVVLCLRRGHGDLPLTTPRINILGSTDDLREQLSCIRQQYPDAPLYGIGSSAGSGLLTRYLGEEADASVFRAAFVYCPGYDTGQAFTQVHPTYSRLMAKKLVRQFITRQQDQLAQFAALPRLQQAQSLADFHDDHHELAGYADRASYVAATNPMQVFARISTPVMIVNSEDDPVCRIGNLMPHLEQIRSMPDAILVITRQGSHCAHYEGWSARSWAHRLMAEYFQAMHGLAGAKGGE